jgi:hypothetical protein
MAMFYTMGSNSRLSAFAGFKDWGGGFWNLQLRVNIKLSHRISHEVRQVDVGVVSPAAAVQ